MYEGEASFCFLLLSSFAFQVAWQRLEYLVKLYGCTGQCKGRLLSVSHPILSIRSRWLRSWIECTRTCMLYAYMYSIWLTTVYAVVLAFVTEAYAEVLAFATE